MKSNYIDSAYIICDLINKNDIETLEKEFPAVIKDLDFILFMSKIYHDVFNIKYDQCLSLIGNIIVNSIG